MRLLFLVLVFGCYVNAFAVTPNVIDFGDVMINEEKKSGFYVFNTEKENLSLTLEYKGKDFVEMEKIIEVDDEKKFVDVKIEVPGNVEKGKHEGEIFIMDKQNGGEIGLSKGYLLKTVFNVVDGIFFRDESFQEIVEKGMSFVSFSKPSLGKMVKLSSVFKNDNEEDYFIMKGEVFVDDAFYELIQSDIFLLREKEKKDFSVYFVPEVSGKYDIHLKVIGDDYESDEKKVSFSIEEKSFFEKFTFNSLLFLGLCFLVCALGGVSVVFNLLRRFSK